MVILVFRCNVADFDDQVIIATDSRHAASNADDALCKDVGDFGSNFASHTCVICTTLELDSQSEYATGSNDRRFMFRMFHATPQARARGPPLTLR